MKINNTQQNINFQGYDARRLKGFVMNSNFEGIAEEMRKIGEIENFKVYLFENSPAKPRLKTDRFEYTQNNKGCWAQDYWGIIGDSLLAFENSPKTETLKNFFNLKNNKFQEFIHEMMNVKDQQEYVDLLYNLPIVKKNGKEFVEIPTPEGSEYIDKKIYDFELEKNSELLKNILSKTHIKGGNYFITKNKQGEDELLIGQNELKKFSIEELQQIFKIKNIHPIPQADFHIDLFLRPLKDKKVLIADDNTMLETLAKGFESIKNAAFKVTEDEREKFRIPFAKTATYFNQFKKILSINPYANMKDVETSLLKAGYEPIKVPSRLFEIFGDQDGNKNSYLLKQLQNYMNANVLINNKNEVVYITNKSHLDESLGLTDEIKEKTGFSLEQAFLDKIKPYVDKVYFVSGENNAIEKKLFAEQYGGIHCMCMEIPE